MEPIQVAQKIKEKFPQDVASIEEFNGQATVYVDKKAIVDICTFLHDDPEMKFNYLRDITAVDYMGKKDIRFEVVYHLYSLDHRHMIRLKAKVSEGDCSIKTVVPIWAGANWHERECYDMFGIVFKGHPDLRRLLMPEDWEGWPLRKDYPITGPGPENEWSGYKAVLEDAERLKEHEWDRSRK
jgi:NADH-quinone oxidoreductase subunit C